MSAATTIPLFDWARWNGQSERTPATSSGGRPPIWERWQAFVKANPQVLEEAYALAKARVARGEKRIGSKALWEELRRHLKVQKIGAYKLNNDFTALLARDLITRDPSLGKHIELRERRSKIDKAIDATTPLRTEPDMPTLPPARLETIDLLNNFVCRVDDHHGAVRATLVSLGHGKAVVWPVLHVDAPTADDAKRELATLLLAMSERILPGA